jgi:hypothetical protein
MIISALLYTPMSSRLYLYVVYMKDWSAVWGLCWSATINLIVETLSSSPRLFFATAQNKRRTSSEATKLRRRLISRSSCQLHYLIAISIKGYTEVASPEVLFISPYYELASSIAKAARSKALPQLRFIESSSNDHHFASSLWIIIGLPLQAITGRMHLP